MPEYVLTLHFGAPDGELRDQIADAILAATYPPDEWPDGPPGEGEMETAREQADAALFVITPMMTQLRGQVTKHRNDATRWRAKALGAVDEAERLRGELAETRTEQEDLRKQLEAESVVSYGFQDERDALKAGIAEAVRQIREWMNPDSDAPLFAPGHAAEVERVLKKYIGERTIAALTTPETAPQTSAAAQEGPR